MYIWYRFIRRNILPGVGKYVQKCSFISFGHRLPLLFLFIVFHAPRIQNWQCFVSANIQFCIHSKLFNTHTEHRTPHQMYSKMRAFDGLFSFFLTDWDGHHRYDAIEFYLYFSTRAGKQTEKVWQILKKILKCCSNEYVCRMHACLDVEVFVVCIFCCVYVCLLRPYFHIYVCRMGAGLCVCRVFMFLFFFFILWLK